MRTRLRRTRRTRAFTLIELMVVIVILGLLAALVMPKVLGRSDQAKRGVAKTQISLLEGALDQFRLDTGRYPTAAEGLNALVSDPGVEGWKEGGYLKGSKVPKDPWRREYIYIYPGAHGEYDIVSLGKDGEEGGSGYDADIQSWNLGEE